MSELYLVLRSRLQEVADWYHLPEGALRQARERVGSRETVARRLHVSQKTLERWEKENRVPRHLISAVATVLHMPIETDTRPPAERLIVRPGLSPDEDPAVLAARLVEKLDETCLLLRRIADLLQAGQPDIAARRTDEWQREAPSREARHSLARVGPT